MALEVIIFLGGLCYILGDEESSFWQKIIKFIMLLVLTFIVATCSNMGDGGWYDSQMKFGDV